MEVTEAAESTSEKEEKQVAVEEQAVVAAPVKLHDLSVCPLWLGFIPEPLLNLLFTGLNRFWITLVS